MMKAEKIEKHMLRRTVVVASDEFDTTVGTIVTRRDGDTPALVHGVRTDQNARERDFNWHETANIRKATDDERAEFFEWLVSDGRDIADGFARFGGMPRGFEAWRAAQDAPVEPASGACSVGWMFTTPKADAPTPEPVVTPQHKVGDLRVGLDHDGTAIVGRVRSIDYDGDIWIGGACCRPDARPLFEPTPENVARLVEQQRARGIEPELGDLVFVLLTGNTLATAIVAHNVSTAPDAKLLQGVMVSGGAFSWGLAPDIAAHTLVIRRNPFREVADE